MEKDALAGVLSPIVIQEFGLDLYITRGFASISYMQEAAEDINDDGRFTYVYLLTDFDPSGMSIADDIERKLEERTEDLDGFPLVEVERLALTRRQIDVFDLPTRPTKKGDKRAKAFMAEHGTGSVELDALPPNVLRGMVRDAIEEHMDRHKLFQLRMVEQQERELLRKVWGNAS